jgi:hypothetical protein
LWQNPVGIFSFEEKQMSLCFSMSIKPNKGARAHTGQSFSTAFQMING